MAMVEHSTGRARCRECEFHVCGICDTGASPVRFGARSDAHRPTDEELVGRHRRERALSDGHAYFGVLVERHQKRVVAWACRVTGSLETARDIAQDVFVKAFVAIDSFRGESRFTTWLYSITRNRCRDYLQAKAARPREVEEAVLRTAPPTVQNDAITHLETQHAAAIVRRLMRDAHLDRVEARAMVLHYGIDMPLERVTAVLGLTNRSGAKAAIVSAMRKLRRTARPERPSPAGHEAVPALGR